MKRLRRWLFNFAAAVSLLLCLATTALWVRSYYRWDSLKHSSPVISGVNQLNTTAESVLGSLTFNFVWRTDLGGWVATGSRWAEPGFIFASQTAQNHPLLKPNLPPPLKMGSSNRHVPIPLDVRVRDRGLHWLGFGHLPEQYTLVQGVPMWKWRQDTILLPHWPLALLFAALPLCSLFVAWHKRRLGRKGVCVTCGYDLRATPDRCPECGTAVPQKAPAA